MARIKNISGEALCLFRSDAPQINAGDTITVRDEVFVGLAWPTDIWEVVEAPVDAVNVSSADAALYLDPTAAPEPPNFSAMTIAELTDYAEANDIDLTGATLKADIVAAIVNPAED